MMVAMKLLPSIHRPTTTRVLTSNMGASPLRVRERRGSFLRKPGSGPCVRWQRPVHLIPVLPDGTPNLTARTSGMSVAISAAGIEIDLPDRNWRIAPVLVIEVPDAWDQASYAGVVVHSFRLLSPESIRIVCRFGGLGAALLQPRNLLPRFNFDLLHFSQRFSEDVLHSWVEAGVLREICLDRLLLCPRCLGLPSFRFENQQDLGHWAKCPRCALRFPWRQAVIRELKGFRSHPLEVGLILRQRRSE